jgi:hypothetical protein
VIDHNLGSPQCFTMFTAVNIIAGHITDAALKERVCSELNERLNLANISVTGCNDPMSTTLVNCPSSMTKIGFCPNL